VEVKFAAVVFLPNLCLDCSRRAGPDDCVVFWELVSAQRPPKEVRRYTPLPKRSFSLLGVTVSESYVRALYEPYGRTLDTL